MGRYRTTIEQTVLDIKQTHEKASQCEAETTDTMDTLILEVLLDIRDMLERMDL